MAVAVALALTAGVSGIAQAAGLGRLTVQSGLGQPLKAEVEITSLSGDEAASLAARLAPAEAFQQAGLEYNPALTGLNFAIDRRSDGRAVVRISSSRVINEPFIDLLVELNWATGKFVREYTFLLDPPELRVGKSDVVEGGGTVSAPVRPTPSVASAPVATRAPAPAPEPARAPERVAVQPAPEPVASSAPTPAPAPMPQAPVVSAPREVAPAVAAPPRRVAQRAAPASATRRSAAAAPAQAGESTVVVKRGDTLADIAGRVKASDTPLDKAIVAIYRANPGAFFGGVHQMRSGVSLSIPDAATMSSLDGAEVRAEMRRSLAAFNEYRSRLAAAPRQVGTPKTGQAAAGAIGEAQTPAAPQESDRDRLKLSRDGVTAGSQAGGAGARDGAAESRVARDNALREAQSRVADLEKNVADLRRLLELKNQQLADLQSRLGKAGAAAGGGDTTTAGPATATPSAPAAAASPAQAGAAMPSTSEKPADAPPAPAGEARPAEGAKPAEAPKPVEAPKPAVTPSAEAPPVAESGGMLDDVLSNPFLIPGALGVVALGGFWAWWSRRRKKKAEAFEDSLGGSDAFTANSLFGTTGGQEVDTSNSLFNTNVRDSGVDVHSTEVDPIAEAEVYIAYGREAQAEEILKEALKRQPERQAIRLKLLEIYAGRKDASVFGALAQEMYDQAGGQNEEWPKVVTLGLSIDPTNPLYTGGGGGAAAKVAEAGERADTAIKAAGGEVKAAAAGAAGALAAGTAGLINALDARGEKAAPANEMPTTFELPKTGKRDTSITDELDSLDFDIDVDSKAGVPGASQSPALDVSGLDDLKFDAFETDNDAAGSKSSPLEEASELSRALEGKIELPSLDLGNDVDFADTTARSHGEPDAIADLGDFKVDIPSIETLRGPASAEPNAVDLSSIGLDLSPNTLTGGAPSADGGRWQEMATKLDLASAYEEIGDKEGARELLEEVLKGGDSQQQQKARAMLSKIS